MPSIVWAVLQWTIGILTLATLILAAIKGIPPAWRIVYQFFITINALSDLPKELAELKTFRSDMASGMEDQNTKIDEIRHEVQYNNESSVKDAVHRIELGVRGLDTQVAELKESDAEIRQQIEKSTGETK